MLRLPLFFSRAFLGLVILGALGWGVIAGCDPNLIAAIFETSSAHSTSGAFNRSVHVLVGVTGMGLLAMLPEIMRLQSRPAGRL